MTTTSAEAKELSLVEKVELRIALADTDTKLQSVLNTYLAPLLLKLASPHLSVRNKVISICQHVNTRTKPDTIQLPVKSLLKQYKDNSQANLVRYFDLLYIQQGIRRLPRAEVGQLFPDILHGIAADTESSAVQGAAMFNLLLRALLNYGFPSKGVDADAKLRSTLEVSDEDAGFMAFWFGKLLLLRLGGAQEEGNRRCPGLSLEEYSFLTLDGKEGVWDPSHDSGLNITEAKAVVLKAMSTGMFHDHERLLPALFASADSNSKLSEIGEELLKRSLNGVSKNTSRFTEQLFQLYFGTGGLDGENAANSVQAARVPVRIKILNVLPKLDTNTPYPETVVRLVEQDLLRDEAFGEPSRPNREELKLRTAVLMFLAHVSRHASQEDLFAIASPVIRSLRDFIERYSGTSRSQDLSSSLGNSFEIISLLAKANVRLLVEPDLELLRWLFDALSTEEDRNVVVSINEAVSTTMRSFQDDLPPAVESRLRETLLQNMKKQTNNSRSLLYLSVCFANKCLAYDDVVARWIDLVALGQSIEVSHETIEEAKRGLDPYWHSLSGSNQTSHPTNVSTQLHFAFPRFSDLARYIFDDVSDLARNAHLFSLSVSYCRQAFVWESLQNHGVGIDLNEDWDRKLELTVSEDQAARSALRKNISSMLNDASDDGFLTLWKSAFLGLALGTTADNLRCVRVFNEFCVFSPPSSRGLVVESCADLEPMLSSNASEIRSLVAQAYGLLASGVDSPSQTTRNSLLRLCASIDGWKDAVGAKVNEVHGSASAVAYFVSRALHQKQADPLATEFLDRLLRPLLSMLDQARDALLQEASYLGLGHLLLFSAVSVEDFDKIIILPDVIEKLSKAAKAGNEKSIATLGYASIILDEEANKELLAKVIENLYALHEIRQPETQFAVGDALSCVAVGWESAALVSTLDVEGPQKVPKSRAETFAALLERTIGACGDTKPALRKAAVIWLLCFIQRCGHRQEVQERLAKFQVAFKRCLSDRDELVQESASRGLGLVYEKGNRDIKDSLVRDLIGSFSSNRADISGTINEDTQLFEPGALPTGDGSITTYKDIMSLASEVGDSSLVYRFMSLASNNAIWSSRAAFGRFGLSNVLSDSSVNGYLAENPKLYPKLYRYRFDPNGSVRKSMNDIWNALVKDSSATIDKYFDEIIEDLLQSIVGREWRIRQASCAAIADLVQGRKIEQIAPYLDRMWSLTFKVLDDIKESVRTAAAGLARVLSNILIRSLESSEGSVQTATRMLERVIPFLMSTSGLESSAEDVRALSLKTLLDIIKKAKAQVLRPFIPELIERLLGMLSTFEPEVINYLHLNAAKYNVTEQKIDEARLSSIRTGPLMEAIERCLDMVDDETMKRLVPRVQGAMKAAVGMPSKVGCSRLLVSLSTRRSAIFRPYADTFLASAQKAVLDRNETVSSSYAASMGYVARGASDQAILRVVAFAKSLYFIAEEERQRIHSGELVHAIGKHATDRFAALAADILPFVFVARHDGDERVQKLFRDVWDENAGGPRAAALYLGEIVALVSEHVASKRWTIRHGAALSVAAAVESVASSKGELTEADGLAAWPALQAALAEKSWDGKERVLDGLVALVKHGSKFWSTRADVKQEITKIALREARRRNAAYRKFAIASLGKIAKHLTDTDLSDEVYHVVEPVIDELLPTAEGAGSADRDDADQDGNPDLLYSETLAAAVEALLCSIRTEAGVAHERRSTPVLSPLMEVDVLNCIFEAFFSRFHADRPQVARVLDLLRRASASPTAPVRLAVFRSGAQFLSWLQLALAKPESVLDRADAIRAVAPPFSDMLFAATGAVSESLRLTRSEAILALAKLASALPDGVPALKERLAFFMSNENSVNVRSTLAQALQLLEDSAAPS